MPAMPTSRTIPSLLDELAARFPAREALVGCGQRYTYAALREEVRAFAKGLHALGVRKGEMVAILMGNQPEWVIADLAICSLGAIMVAINTWVTTRELGYVLAHSDATTLIASDHFLRYDYFAMLDDLGRAFEGRDFADAGDVASVPLHPELEVLVGVEALGVDRKLGHACSP